MDLADQVDGYICTFEGQGDLAMDALYMWIFVLVLLVVAVLALVNWRRSKKNAELTGTTDKKIDASAIKDLNAVASGLKITPGLSKEAPAGFKSGAVGGMKAATSDSNLFKAAPSGGLKAGPGPATVRKRLTRKSPGPEIQRRDRSVGPRAPPISSITVGGDNERICQWTGQVFRWLYSDLVIVNDLLYGWIQTLNGALYQSPDEGVLCVELVRVLPETTAPAISNIFCDNTTVLPPQGSQVMITFDVETTIILQVKAHRQTAQRNETLHYRVTLARLKARLSCQMDYTQLTGNARFEGYPDLKMTAAAVGAIKITGAEDARVQANICEQLGLAFRETIYPIDFSIHATCPRALKMEEDEVGQFDFSHQDNGYDQFSKGMGAYDNYDKDPNAFEHFDKSGDAYATNGVSHSSTNNNGYNHQDAGSNYDKTKEGSNYFDERRAANMSFNGRRVHPAAVMQPQYQPPVRRLLVKIVKASGLMGDSQSSQSLQPHCVVEMDEPPQKNQTGAKKGSAPMWDEHFLFDLNHASSEILFEVYDGARFLGLGLVGVDELKTGQTSSQTIALQPRPFESERVSGAIYCEFVFVEGAQQTDGKRPYKLKEALKISNTNLQATPQAMAASPILHNGSNSVNTNGSDSGEKKRTSIFGTIRKRLSRSKTRNSSLERDSVDQNGQNSRSLSLDRSYRNSRNLTPQSPNSLLPMNSMPHHNSSRRSSLSEASAISGMSSASAKTFLHEASSLVLEVLENGVKKHYLVPLAIAQKQRWRRKGTKLHIYNDHTFVAKHIQSGLICEICARSFARRPGKQGYECRDCLMKCHKDCHVRCPQLCRTPTILSIELSRIDEEPSMRQL